MFRRFFNVNRSVQVLFRQKRKCHENPGMISADTDEEFICMYENFFNRPDIDSWEVRKGMCNLHGSDLIPEPRIVIAGLNACRRLNDYALAIRFLESVQFKSMPNKKIWPYILQEINPTLQELGIETPEELGYHKPELAYIDYYYE